MATTHTKNGESMDATFEQVKDFNDQFLAASRKVGNYYLDSYEKTVDRAIELELKMAGLTQQEWLRNLIEAHVDFAREVSSSYASTARSLLK